MSKMKFDDWMLSEYRPISGGEDPPVETPPAEPLVEPAEGDPPISDGGEPPEPGEADGPMPREAWNKLYGKKKQADAELTQWGELGNRDDVQGKLARLDQYEQALEQHRQRQGMTPEQETREKIRQQLLEVYPELKGLDRLKELDDLKSSRTDQVMDQASSHLAGILKTAKIEADEELQDDIEDLLLARMTDDERGAFEAGDFSVMEEKFEAMSQTGLLSRLTNQGSTPPPTPPARLSPGGTTPKPAASKAKTFDEAEKEAWARLQAASEEGG